jgi:uncharacterized protein YkwD
MLIQNKYNNIKEMLMYRIFIYLMLIYSENIQNDNTQNDNAKNMIKLTNTYRRMHGLKELKVPESLRLASELQANTMCKEMKVTHKTPFPDRRTLRKRLEYFNFKGSNIGENIAKQQNDDFKEVFKVWSKSDLHKKNLLGDYNYMGVSTCVGKDKNRYWVQVFGKGYVNWKGSKYNYNNSIRGDNSLRDNQDKEDENMNSPIDFIRYSTPYDRPKNRNIIESPDEGDDIVFLIKDTEDISKIGRTLPDNIHLKYKGTYKKFAAVVDQNNPEDPYGGQSTTQIPGQTNTQVPGQTNTQVPGQTNTQVPGQTNTQIPGQTNTQVPGQTNTQAPGQNTTEIPGQTNTQIPGQTNTQAPGQTNTQIPGQNTTEIPGQTNTQAPGQTNTQAPGQNTTQVPEQNTTQVPGQTTKISKDPKLSSISKDPTELSTIIENTASTLGDPNIKSASTSSSQIQNIPGGISPGKDDIHTNSISPDINLNNYVSTKVEYVLSKILDKLDSYNGTSSVITYNPQSTRKDETKITTSSSSRIPSFSSTTSSVSNLPTMTTTVIKTVYSYETPSTSSENNLRTVTLSYKKKTSDPINDKKITMTVNLDRLQGNDSYNEIDQSRKIKHLLTGLFKNNTKKESCNDESSLDEFLNSLLTDTKNTREDVDIGDPFYQEI